MIAKRDFFVRVGCILLDKGTSKPREKQIFSYPRRKFLPDLFGSGVGFFDKEDLLFAHPIVDIVTTHHHR